MSNDSMMNLAADFKRLINPILSVDIDENQGMEFYRLNGYMVADYIDRVEKIFRAVNSAIVEKTEGYTQNFDVISKIEPTDRYEEKMMTWQVNTVLVKYKNALAPDDPDQVMEIEEPYPKGSDKYQLALKTYLELSAPLIQHQNKYNKRNKAQSKSKSKEFSWHSFIMDKVVINDENVKGIVDSLNRKYTINLKPRDFVDFLHNVPSSNGPKIIWRKNTQADTFIKYMRAGLDQKGGDYKQWISHYFLLSDSERVIIDSSGLKEKNYKDLRSICDKIIELYTKNKA